MKSLKCRSRSHTRFAGLACLVLAAGNFSKCNASLGPLLLGPLSIAVAWVIGMMGKW